MSSIKYREAKRILAKQEEAREVINQYRGIETLGDRLGMKSNRELILTLFEIEENESVIEVLTHLRELYPDEWSEALSAASPEAPGELPDQEPPKVKATPVAEPVPIAEPEPVA